MTIKCKDKTLSIVAFITIAVFVIIHFIFSGAFPIAAYVVMAMAFATALRLDKIQLYYTWILLAITSHTVAAICCSVADVSSMLRSFIILIVFSQVYIVTLYITYLSSKKELYRCETTDIDAWIDKLGGCLSSIAWYSNVSIGTIFVVTVRDILNTIGGVTKLYAVAGIAAVSINFAICAVIYNDMMGVVEYTKDRIIESRRANREKECSQ